ncbi:MAG: tripartite tricarboxylate transporter TctB family protein [Gammaproteobacteria bacterium]|jgi:putative tricarboxylic transport membrane protein|nr:tripartite tricarboxylate transporter TctB family protein [Gammaproteobacteria bacterium]
MNSKKAHVFFDLIVIATIAALVAWYLYDAYSASSHIINLILVLPLSLIILSLCIIEFINRCKDNDPIIEKLEPVSSVVPVICLFILYITSLAWLGFDVGTSLFIAAFLWLHGERRLIWVLAYSIAFGFLVALFFSSMLPYPMPMLILPSQY